MSASLDEEWARLQRHLSFSDGFWLGFVCAADPSAVNELRERAALAAPTGLKTLTVETPASLLDLLQGLEREAGGADTLLWVDAVHVGAEWEEAWQSFLLRANERRDRWRQTLAGGLVLAGPRALREWAREAAPDLWSIRSLVLEPEAAPRVDPRFLDVLRAVSPREESRLVGRDPAGLLAEAARLPVNDPRRLSLLTHAAASLARAGRPNEALRWMAEVDRGGAKQPAARVRAESWASIAEAEAAQDPIGAEAHITRAIDLWGETNEGTPLWWMGRACDYALAANNMARARAWAVRRVATARRVEKDAAVKVEARHQLAAALEQSGNLELRGGDAEAAYASHHAALELRTWLEKNAAGEGMRRDVAMSLENMGRASWAKGDRAAAESSWLGAVTRYQELAAAPDAPREALEDLAIGLELLGDAREARGATDHAWMSFHEALGHQLRFARASGDVQAAWDNARLLRQKVAKFARARGDFVGEAWVVEAMADAYRASIEASEAPVARRRALANELTELAYLRDITGAPQQAITALREAVERWREVIAVSGFEDDAVAELAYDLARLADVQERSGDSTGALTSIEESLALSRQRAEREGASFGAPWWFFAKTVCLARIAAAAGRHELARDALDAARALVVRLSDDEALMPDSKRRVAGHMERFASLVLGGESSGVPPVEARCPRCAFDTDPRDGWSCRCGHTWEGWLREGRCPSCTFFWDMAQCRFCGCFSPRAGWQGPS